MILSRGLYLWKRGVICYLYKSVDEDISHGCYTPCVRKCNFDWQARPNAVLPLFCFHAVCPLGSVKWTFIVSQPRANRVRDSWGLGHSQFKHCVIAVWASSCGQALSEPRITVWKASYIFWLSVFFVFGIHFFISKIKKRKAKTNEIFFQPSHLKYIFVNLHLSKMPLSSSVFYHHLKKCKIWKCFNSVLLRVEMLCWNFSDKTKEFPVSEPKTDIWFANIPKTLGISALRWIEFACSILFCFVFTL